MLTGYRSCLYWQIIFDKIGYSVEWAYHKDNGSISELALANSQYLNNSSVFAFLCWFNDDKRWTNIDLLLLLFDKLEIEVGRWLRIGARISSFDNPWNAIVLYLESKNAAVWVELRTGRPNSGNLTWPDLKNQVRSEISN